MLSVTYLVQILSWKKKQWQSEILYVAGSDNRCLHEVLIKKSCENAHLKYDL